MDRFSCAVFGLCLLAGGVTPGLAGKIVVANDEWTLSDTGLTDPYDGAPFARNVAAWFTDGQPGSFLVYSTNFGLANDALAAVMTGEGHSWVVSTSLALSLATLQEYDAVFLAGHPADTGVLIQYVQAGGNVYLAAGTNQFGNAAGEASAWNPFLAPFGLQFEAEYNTIVSDFDITSGHPLFAGVRRLYQLNGNSIIDLTPADNASSVLVSHLGEGLYAVYVPEPAMSILLGLGLTTVLRRRA